MMQEERVKLIVQKDSHDWKFMWVLVGISIIVGAVTFTVIYALLK